MTAKPVHITDRIAPGYYDHRRVSVTFREAGTDDWLLVCNRRGAARYQYPGGAHVSRRGDFVMIAPQTKHDYGVEPRICRWEVFWVHFHPRAEWSGLLRWPELSPGLMHLTIPDRTLRLRIERQMEEMLRLYQSASRHRETFAFNALEEILLWCDTLNPRSAQAPLDPRVHAAVDYISTHLAEPLTLAILARACGLSISRLAHLFRRQVGQTPQQFWERRRIERAMHLLQITSQTVKEIAAACGFNNPFYFTLRFKQFTGFSPRAYRRRQLSHAPRQSD